ARLRARRWSGRRSAGWGGRRPGAAVRPCRPPAAARDGDAAGARRASPLRCSSSHPLLGGLSGLAADMLPGLAHALALVRVGLAQPPDVGRHLADLLLVDALDREPGRAGDLEGDALGSLDRDLVGVAEAEHQVRALGLDPVADPLDLELLLEPLGDALDHVG